MLIYIISFVISLFFFNLSRSFYKEKKILDCFYIKCSPKKQNISYLYLFISVLTLSILAGVRDTKIGTDVNFYVVPDFATAKAFPNFFRFIRLNLGREKGYMSIVYLVARLTPGTYKSDIYILLFVLSFLTVGIAFIAFFRMRKEISASLAIIIYLFMHYNGTYNAVRQYLAESIILLAISYLDENDYKKYSILIIIASLFHSGSILLLVLPVVYFIVQKYKKHSATLHMIEFIVFSVMIVVIWNIKRIVILLNAIGVLDDHYLYYVNNESMSTNNIETVIYLGEFLFLVFVSDKKINIKNIDFYRIICMLSLVLLQLGRFVYYGNRLSMYLAIINIITICKIPYYFKNNSGRKIVMMAISVVMITYWIFYYIIGNCGETYPYVPYFSK